MSHIFAAVTCQTREFGNLVSQIGQDNNTLLIPASTERKAFSFSPVRAGLSWIPGVMHVGGIYKITVQQSIWTCWEIMPKSGIFWGIHRTQRHLERTDWSVDSMGNLQISYELHGTMYGLSFREQRMGCFHHGVPSHWLRRIHCLGWNRSGSS